ncbi:MAG: hypothetical protein RSE07_04180, partial [Oscillospiraceae bacterium]
MVYSEKCGFCMPDKEQQCCYNPADLLVIASAISLLLYNNFSFCQLETLANLFQLINYDLSALIAQIEIKKTHIAMENYIRKKLKEYKEEMLDYQEKIRNLYMYDFTDYEYIE